MEVMGVMEMPHPNREATMMLLRNRHPADDLADVRAEIKQLQIREAELREELVQANADRRGVQWEATVYQRSREQLDLKAAKKQLGRDVLTPFLRQITFQNVRLKHTRKSKVRAIARELEAAR
jgi:hypothetical protein